MAGSCGCDNETSGSKKMGGGYLLTSEGTVSFSSRALLLGVGEVVCVVSFSRRPDPLS